MKSLLANKPLALTVAVVVVAAAAAAIFFLASPDVDEPPVERGVNTGQGQEPKIKPTKTPKPPKECKPPKAKYGKADPKGSRHCRPKP